MKATDNANGLGCFECAVFSKGCAIFKKWCETGGNVARLPTPLPPNL